MAVEQPAHSQPPQVSLKSKPSLAAAFANVAYELRQLNMESTRARVFGATFVGMLSFMALSRLIMFPVLAQMLIYTLPIIWLGSHLSLDLRVGAEEGSRDRKEGEVLSSADAAMFPVFASAAIVVLYLALKFLPSHIVNVILSVYVTVVGIYSVGETIAVCLNLGFPSNTSQDPQYTFRFPALMRRIFGESVTLKISRANVIGYIAGAFITLGWFATKAWALHNLFAIGFCVQAIHLVSVGSFKVASILLVGLFIYDVFWVFGTDVMVKVATGFEAPLKLLFPIKRAPVQFSLLGLGDIVIPGIFIAMTLRFDYWLQSKRSEISKDCPPMMRNFTKFYFRSSISAYALSIFLTGCIMLFFKKAQPALLYLVPAMLMSLYIPAIFRGELKHVIEFSEDDEKEQENEAESTTSEENEDEGDEAAGEDEDETEAKKDK